MTDDMIELRAACLLRVSLVRPPGPRALSLLEADESAKFYEERQDGLGKRFVDALTDAIIRIRRTPELFGKVDDNIRKSGLLEEESLIQRTAIK